MTQFITPAGLTELDNYKYVGGEYSWLDNKINPFWYKLAEFLPRVKKIQLFQTLIKNKISSNKNIFFANK